MSVTHGFKVPTPWYLAGLMWYKLSIHTLVITFDDSCKQKHMCDKP